MDGGLQIINGKFGHYVKVNEKNISIELLYENENEPSTKEIMEYIKLKLEWKVGKKVYKLNKGEYGYYITEFIDDVKRINIPIKFLLQKITKDNNCETDEEAINLIKKDDIKEYVNNTLKEWKVGKEVYKLNKGDYGYYITEFIDDVRSINIPIKFLLQKITKDNKCETDEEAINLIEKDDIKEYVKKQKAYLENKA